MKLCLKILAIVIIAASTYSIIGCAAPASFSYQNVAITLSVQCADCPAITYNPAQPSVLLEPNSGQGGVYLFTAQVTNAPANITWNVYPTPNLSEPGVLPTGTAPTGTTGGPAEFNPAVGTVSAASGNTAYFTQNGVPVYTGASLLQAQALGIPQGDTLLVASVPSDPNNPSAVATASVLIQHFNGSTVQGPPSVFLTPRTPLTPAGLVNPVVTVSHLAPNNTFQFVGGVVGAAPCLTVTTCTIQGTLYPTNTTDNTPVWEVGPAPFSLSTAIPCTVPATCPYGTISSTGLYTAPTVIPATQPVVVLVSHLVPTVNAFAYVAVN
jgi:hypothetical protein